MEKFWGDDVGWEKNGVLEHKIANIS